MPVDVEVVVDPALKRPTALKPYLRAGMEAAVERVREAGERSIATLFRASNRRDRPAKPGYGPLAGSLRTQVARNGASGFVGTDVFYGRFLEFGATAHFLAPDRRRARALMFRTPGGVIWRPYAHHPGVRAHHWLRGAANSEQAQVNALFVAATQRWSDAVFAGGGGLRA